MFLSQEMREVDSKARTMLDSSTASSWCPAQYCSIPAAVVAMKLSYFACLCLALVIWPLSAESGRTSTHVVWTIDGHLTFGSHFASWDAEHYLFLSETGYHSGLAQCAFYPLFPLLVRWASSLTRIDDVLVALVISNLFSGVAFILFYRMTARRLGRQTAALALALLLAYPGSLFFQFIYSESLFLLLLILFCDALDRGKIRRAAFTAFLLPLARAVGVLCLCPLAVYLFSAPQSEFVARFGPVSKRRKPIESEAELPKQAPAWGWTQTLFALTAPLFGWFVYLFLMWRWTGNPFEGFAAQRSFGVESIQNLFHPVTFFLKLFTPTTWHSYKGSLLDRASFLLLVSSLPHIWKLDRMWFVLSLSLGVIPAVSGGFTSLVRFMSVVFPLFIALADILHKRNRRWLLWITLALFGVLHLLLVWRFVNFRWAG